MMANNVSRARSLCRRVWAVVEEAFFPAVCAGCGAEDAWVCDRCAATVSMPTALTCFLCGRPSFDGRFCSECARGRSVKGVWAITHYATPVAQLFIQRLKYNGVYASVGAAERWFARFAHQWPFLFPATTCYIPVPLHPSKEQHRGFNQAHLLTAVLLRTLGRGTCGCWLLRRDRATVPQVTLSREDRQKNVLDAFAYCGPEGIGSKQRVVLVDDVSTTGATLDQCGRVMQKHGWTDVWGFVLAKG